MISLQSDSGLVTVSEPGNNHLQVLLNFRLKELSSRKSASAKQSKWTNVKRQGCCEGHKDDVELDSDDESGHSSPSDDDCTSGDTKLLWWCGCAC